MRRLLLLAPFLLATAPTLAQTQPATTKTTPTTPLQIVEASCGQCRLGLPGKGCDLAVRIGGKAYFVDGTGIDQHGDAHAKDGFCNAIRRAEVRGQIVNNRFVATHFRLLPDSAVAR